MKQFIADSTYHQFYVADRILEPEAPTEWTDKDVEARHVTLENIVALSPESDLDARITSCGPGDVEPTFPDEPDFELITQIIAPSRKVGIYGWPWELEDEYEIGSEECEITFRGFALERKEEDGDYYLVKVVSKRG